MHFIRGLVTVGIPQCGLERCSVSHLPEGHETLYIHSGSRVGAKVCLPHIPQQSEQIVRVTFELGPAPGLALLGPGSRPGAAWSRPDLECPKFKKIVPCFGGSRIAMVLQILI